MHACRNVVIFIQLFKVFCAINAFFNSVLAICDGSQNGDCIKCLIINSLFIKMILDVLPQDTRLFDGEEWVGSERYVETCNRFARAGGPRAVRRRRAAA